MQKIKRYIFDKRMAVTSAVWLLMATLTTAAASPDEVRVVVVNSYGIAAPFLVSWIPVWVFVALGAIGSIFFRIPEVDEHFRWLTIAKPFLGLCAGMSLCLLTTDGSDPPAVGLAAYGMAAALFGAPLLQILLAIVMVPRNQAGFLNSINPFKFKIVVEDKGADDADNK